jgi:signal transduction histidine kinase
MAEPPSLPEEPSLPEKIRRTEENVERAKEEVRKLTVQLKNKTLDQQTLESGLKDLTTALDDVPHFSPKHGPHCR